MVVLNHEEHEVGILVNKIEGKYQAVIKPLNNRIQTLEVFSGASILGDGNIALVIDSNKLINKLYNKNG
jgi:two-component system chemotaxis sensor kinase CheA